MNKFPLVLILVINIAQATPNSAVSVRETLLGLTDTSYFVLRTEWEIKTTWFNHEQRVLLIEYGLETNAQRNFWILSSNQLQTDAERLNLTISPVDDADIDLSQLLKTVPVVFAGFPKTPSKEFVIDENGIAVLERGSREYVMSGTDLKKRIQNLDDLLMFEDIEPRVIGLHTEPGEGRLRYILLVRSGEWRSDVSSFELVISLPEN